MCIILDQHIVKRLFVIILNNEIYNIYQQSSTNLINPIKIICRLRAGYIL